jgi:hypothetical protein
MRLQRAYFLRGSVWQFQAFLDLPKVFPTSSGVLVSKPAGSGFPDRRPREQHRRDAVAFRGDRNLLPVKGVCGPEVGRLDR